MDRCCHTPLALDGTECQAAGHCRKAPPEVKGSLALSHGECQPRPASRAGAGLTASVLRAADAAQPVLEVRRVLHDLREAHDGHGVLERDALAVDLLEEVDELLGAAELGVVVLDVAR